MCPNCQDAKGLAPLHLAAKLGCVEICELLLENGASVDQRDAKEHTPAHYAAGYGQLRVLEVLELYQADFNAVNSEAMSPVNLAFLRKKTGCVKWLSERGFTNDNMTGERSDQKRSKQDKRDFPKESKNKQRLRRETARRLK
jgi:ankyrin repeat protein